MAKPDFLQDLPENIAALLNVLAERTEVPICYMEMPGLGGAKYLILAAEPTDEGIEVGPFHGNPFTILERFDFIESLGKNALSENEILLTDKTAKRRDYQRAGRLCKWWMTSGPGMKAAAAVLLSVLGAATVFAFYALRLVEFLAKVFNK